ncbi:MAG: 2-oxoglutarate dehydrogenase, E2 component, dihydrolipoamide succinyltransferase [Terriglobales bacterium]
MPTDVVMPQMGESIFEGTITKWLKKPGDKVNRDEPLFEISTDKVDAEIPSPTAGVLKEIKVPEGTTVQVNTVVGTIAAEGEAAASAPAPQTQASATEKTAPAVPASQAEKGAPAASPTTPEPAKTAAKTTGGAVSTEGPAQPQKAPPQTQQPAAQSDQQGAAAQKHEVVEFPHAAENEGERVRSSPLVRRIARENSVDLDQVPGTGLGGRITKEDILQFVEHRPAPGQRPAAAASAGQQATAAAQRPPYQPGAAAPSMPQPQPMAIPGELVAMSPMRKKIAERMVESKRTSAHVHSVFEVDLTRVITVRQREKQGFEQRTGTRLTMMPFFCRAAIEAIRAWPIINASVEGDNLRYHRNVNLGIAVALDWGLIVPVIKRAEELNFLGLQRAIIDLADRARSKKLLPDEVAGGTFTITNPGSYGQMFGLPIIMQPQVAILGVGSIKKQPVVVTDENSMDSIAIRSVGHIILGYDHRVIDGAVGDQYLRDVAKYLENWNEPLG